jgi:hypothetical protein
MEKTGQGSYEGSRKPGFRNVYAMGLVSFFTDVSTEMVTGYLPVFIVRDLDGTKTVLGLIEGLESLLTISSGW